MARQKPANQQPASDANSGAGEVLTQAEEQQASNAPSEAPEASQDASSRAEDQPPDSSASSAAGEEQAPQEVGLSKSHEDAPGEDAAPEQEDVAQEEYVVHLNPEFGDRQQLVIVGDQQFYAGQSYTLTNEQYEEAKDAELDGLPVLKEGGAE